MAEREGFEPPVPLGITGFQDQRHKPLGHLSSLLEPAEILYDSPPAFVNPFFQNLCKAGGSSVGAKKPPLSAIYRLNASSALLPAGRSSLCATRSLRAVSHRVSPAAGHTSTKPRSCRSCGRSVTSVTP